MLVRQDTRYCTWLGGVAGNGRGEDGQRALKPATNQYKEVDVCYDEDHNTTTSQQSDKDTNRQNSANGLARDHSASFSKLTGGKSLRQSRSRSKPRSRSRPRSHSRATRGSTSTQVSFASVVSGTASPSNVIGYEKDEIATKVDELRELLQQQGHLLDFPAPKDEAGRSM
ncbi:hypothetical protein HPB51_009371 [Rhipicephalus microplus]|uniref:Uncharacterized protein n=1 Tax=Rhipicephalus microplus TaxID=6941 RepID=A0A9J6F0E5_RHIMP|nr:hypothetical protein HPB51_009371 [Rhipicephalus microplus]